MDWARTRQVHSIIVEGRHSLRVPLYTSPVNHVVSVLTEMAPANPQIEGARRMSSSGTMSEHLWVTLRVPDYMRMLPEQG